MYINNDIDYIKFLADKDVYIFGAGERGIILSKRCKKNNLRVRAFLDNNIKESVNGIPCIHPNSFLEANKQHSMIIIRMPDKHYLLERICSMQLLILL